MADRTTSCFLAARELSRRLGCEGYEVTRFFSEAPNSQRMKAAIHESALLAGATAGNR